MPTSEPQWIEFEQVVALHDAILRHFGGGDGFPHPHYLDSALHAPKQHHHYSGGGCDLFDLAAVYLFHIAKAHAFTDGNKRTAYLTAIFFLWGNGVDVNMDRNRLVLAKATEQAAKGELDKAALAEIMRRMPGPPKTARRRQRLRPPARVTRRSGRKRRGRRRSGKRLL